MGPLDLFYPDWPIFDAVPTHDYEPLCDWFDDICRFCAEFAWSHPDWPQRREALLAELIEIGEI